MELSYAAPSKVRSLIVPLGDLKGSLFKSYLLKLQSVNEVRLVDVSPPTTGDGGEEKNLFSPLGYPNGRLFYDMVTSSTDHLDEHLFDLEPWRQTLCVFGVAHYDNFPENALVNLRQEYSKSLLHKVFVFGAPETVTDKHIIYIPHHKSVPVTTLRTIMCDITTDFLAELASLYTSRTVHPLKSPSLKEMELPSATSNGEQIPTMLNARLSISRENYTTTGSISVGLSDRAKVKQQGRMLKYKGSLFLLSGRLSDAIKELCEAVNVLKSAFDHLWHASALESIGVALILQSYLELPSSIPTNVLTNSANIPFNNSSVPALQRDSSQHKHLPSQSSISSLRSVSSSTSAQGSSVVNQRIAEGTAPPLEIFENELTEAALRLYSRQPSSVEEGVPKSVYCDTILRYTNLLAGIKLAGGLEPSALAYVVKGTPIESPIAIVTNASIISSWLGRILLLDMASLPILNRVMIYSAMAKIYGSVGLARKKAFIQRELINAVLSRLTPDGESNLQQILDFGCDIYSGGDVNSKGFGWAKLKKSFLETCLEASLALDDYSAVLTYGSTLLATCADIMDNNEQVNAYQSIQQAARKSTIPIAADYWDVYTLRDISFKQMLTVPIEKVPEKLPAAGENGPLIYNPFINKPTTISATSVVIVADEPTDVFLRLQNPFKFALEIESLSLVCEGANVISGTLQRRFSLAPETVSECILTLITDDSADYLKIVGCDIKFAACKSKLFQIPENIGANASVIADSKIKAVGHDSAKSSTQARFLPKSSKSVTLSVAHKQPILSLRSLSLSQGAAMLLEGETIKLSIDVGNSSKLSANWIKFILTDSTIEPLQSAMMVKDKPLPNVYEIEFYLFQRKALAVDFEDGNFDADDLDPNLPANVFNVKSELKPHSVRTYTLTLKGKRGMTDANIQIAYSHLSDDRETPSYMRKLNIPFSVTVNAAIEISRFDVMRIEEPNVFAMLGLNVESTSEYCILSLDLRNTWTNPMDVKLISMGGCECKGYIVPGNTQRILLPIPLAIFEDLDTTQPIPLKVKRQFVVDSATDEQKRLSLESFWCKQRLLSILEGSWKSDNRSGEIDLRPINVNSAMASIFLKAKISIEMEGPELVELDEDYVLTTTVSNMTSEAVQGIVELQVTSMDNLEDVVSRMLWNGCLRHYLQLEPGEKKSLKTGFMCISRGIYEWNSFFDCHSASGARSGYSTKKAVTIEV